MASNRFGKQFCVTTWGESHGKAIGLVIDGCPAGLPLSEAEVQAELAWRMPGKSAYTSPRKEPDTVEILSGIFDGQTTGTPIAMIIPNRDADSSKYTAMQNVARPGHANWTYQQKYGICDWRGGGRASGRETACRVAAGAVAKKILEEHEIEVVAFLKELGSVTAEVSELAESFELRRQTRASELFCPDIRAEKAMRQRLEECMQSGDSLGGVVEARAVGQLLGLGDPVYEKLEAALAQAMLSLPAAKGFEIGSGFAAARMHGSEHNDLFVREAGGVRTRTNYSGGILGGIANGMPITLRVAFKPPSSIRIPQETVDMQDQPQTLRLPEGSRHDPSVAIRAVPVVEAMLALTLVDALLMNRLARI